MSILFKNADILIFENNEFQIVKNGFLGVSETKIDYIGEEEPPVKYDIKKDMSGKLLMPGLINCHGHSSMTLFRGVGSSLPLNDWLKKIFSLEDLMTIDDVVVGADLAIMEMLSTGTTSYSDMYFFPFAVAERCVGPSGIKANMNRVFMGVTEDYKKHSNRCDALDFNNQYNNAFNGRLLSDWLVHSEYTTNLDFAQKFCDEILPLGGRIQFHLSETKKEQDECIAKYGVTPAKWFEKIGFLKLHGTAAHCVWVTDEDIDILKENNISVAHNPTSNLKLGSGIAPVSKMLQKGINVCLGTDGCASNNNLNMFEEMHITSIIHNGYNLEPSLIKATEVLKMATVNGAISQQRYNTGVLKVGNCADIIALNLDSPHLQPSFDIASLLVYSAQGSDVCMTMVDGKILYENGEFFTLDKEKIYYEFSKSVKKLNIK